jgi:hypothetical protein
MRSFASLHLFEPDPGEMRVLARGEHGTITYEPRFLPVPRATE